MAFLRLPAAKIAILCFLTLAVFWRVFQADFIFVDDVRYIHGNPYFNPLSVENVSKVWTEPYLNLYVPIPLTIWAIESALFRTTDPASGKATLNAGLFHATNLLFHLGSVLLIFLILQLLFESSWAAMLGAAIFAVQPMALESVAWISGLRDVAAGFFGFASLYFLLRSEGKKRDRRFYWLALFSFLAALLSKATVVSLPLIAGVLLWARSGRPWKKAFFTVLPFLLMGAFFGWLAASLQSGERLSHDPPPFWTQPIIALDSYFHYLARIVFPWPVIFDNGHTPAAALASRWIPLRAGLTLLAASLAFAHFRRTREKWILAAFLVVVLGVLPVSGIKPFIFQFISTVGDRYFYLSLFGVALGMAYWLADEQRNRLVAAGVLVLVYAGITSSQVPHWKNTVTLFNHNLVYFPESWFSHNLLGQRARDRGDLQSAIYHFEKGGIVGRNPEPLTNLAVLYLQAKQYDAAIRAFERAVEYKPLDPGAQQNLGVAYMQAGKNALAVERFERALALDPTLQTSQEALRKMGRTPASHKGN